MGEKTSIWIYEGDLFKIINNSHTKGKYLFFSKDREELVELAKIILKTTEVKLCKVPADGYRWGKEWVLCAFYKENLIYDLMRTLPFGNIIYRGWKTEEDTSKGIYHDNRFSNYKNVESKEKDKFKTDFQKINKTMGNY